MFTLNELYATSISATTNLLLSLTMLLDPGALLLVVDSPGSYSTVKIGKSSRPSESSGERKYPMQWLLDHTLLEASAVGSSKVASGQRQWEKVDGREAEWFRLDGELRYPIELEDMRYQLHLYRRV
ncbi:25S rRNA (uracil2843-N3)-methyltransferase, partial [Lecanoromycetidae sp. Uapishka_2]